MSLGRRNWSLVEWILNWVEEYVGQVHVENDTGLSKESSEHTCNQWNSTD